MKQDFEPDPATDALRDPAKITKAIRLARQAALRAHVQTGNPIVVWRDGEVVWIPPEEIALGEGHDESGGADHVLPQMGSDL